MATMADGIAVGRPGDVPFTIVQEHVDEIRTVTEEQLSRAVLLLLERAKLVVEPAGAAGACGAFCVALDMALAIMPAMPAPMPMPAPSPTPAAAPPPEGFLAASPMALAAWYFM